MCTISIYKKNKCLDPYGVLIPDCYDTFVSDIEQVTVLPIYRKETDEYLYTRFVSSMYTVLSFEINTDDLIVYEQNGFTHVYKVKNVKTIPVLGDCGLLEINGIECKSCLSKPTLSTNIYGTGV